MGFEPVTSCVRDGHQAKHPPSCAKTGLAPTVDSQISIANTLLPRNSSRPLLKITRSFDTTATNQNRTAELPLSWFKTFSPHIPYLSLLVLPICFHFHQHTVPYISIYFIHLYIHSARYQSISANDLLNCITNFFLPESRY